MEREGRISAVVSATTRLLLEKQARATGVKKSTGTLVLPPDSGLAPVG